ncbi:YxiG-like protein [Streptomyces lichenis]|uniref:YxiG-like domain-containing protein n=1 Tax=Streptomyces lichenis TaxID=2306967 RepID=A0ABT0I6A2_9ACTN|nr:hypothetical protein [Streptomyces lichenis]MCK8676850.1 hypothetical protein [Streptomyces lichenis]
MDAAAFRQLLDDTFDHSVVHHGYTDYLRDYEVVVQLVADPSTGIAPTRLRYLFRYCVEARCETTVPPGTWRISLDDRLTDQETAADLDGYVWGVKSHVLYPGAKLLPESEAARRWSDAIGIDFHQVLIETNAHRLTLLFSGLEVTQVPTAYAPMASD